jgi:NACalpha-BTF3-like transcription factor
MSKIDPRSPFYTINAIAYGFKGEEFRPENVNLAGWNLFIAMDALSNRVDAISAVSIVNYLHEMPEIAQYRILKELVAPRKTTRDERWIKIDDHSRERDVKNVMEYYNISRERAIELVEATLSDDDLNEIASRLEFGF